MNRMDKIFTQMVKENDKILVAYFPLGDSIFDSDLEWGKKYFENGATLLEMGLPYENPVLDGKIVRESMERALKNTTLDNVFTTIKELRKKFPNNILQIMTYFEIVEKYGIDKFAEICNECDVDAVLAPNAPIEKFPEIDKALNKYNIHYLRFAPFNLNSDIINDLKENAKGYVFLQAVDGATGPQKTVSPQIGKNVKILKEAGISIPIVAGFGISNPEQAKEAIRMGADGCIVGSSILSNIIEGDGDKFIYKLKDAMR